MRSATERRTALLGFLLGLAYVAYFAIVIGVGYVAIHFVVKFW